MWGNFSKIFRYLLAKEFKNVGGTADHHSQEFIQVKFGTFDEMHACNTIGVLSEAALF
jgi:hypothetical protein